MKNFNGKLEGKITLGKSTHIQEDNIKWTLNKQGVRITIGLNWLRAGFSDRL
jgi:hypothetical protein